MRSAFDRRVVPAPILNFILACQRRVPCHLGGGAALSGAHLSHRLSGDIDLFCHDATHVRDLMRELPATAAEAGVTVTVARDAGTFVRAVLATAAGTLDVDIVHEALPDLEPPPPLEGVVVESFADLRAAKLTCILSRSEPRDLVDLLFLERAGHPPEGDLPLALRKDGGIDPGVLAWLLGQFPVRPLPQMLLPLDEAELLSYRDALATRFKTLAIPL